ncbi:MAG TPA: GNAT family N-acetyltransferase [Terracidiphilus sp.]|nr:GNAT family N-acetyltransferase [Terracidiphilus sp.]
MEQTLTIRSMEPADAEAVAALTRQLGYERGPEEIRAWIAEAGPDDRQAAFVARLEGKVVGWIEVSAERKLQSAPFALIGGLVVDEGVRSRGIGLVLLRHAEGWAWERGLERVRVTSRSTREAAHRFYLRDGYEAVKTSLVFEKKRR